MMNMMDSTGAVIALMVVLVLLVGGIFITVRVLGGKDFNEDHDG